MANIYILYSKKTDKYYVGSTTLTIEERLVNHNDRYYENKYTSSGIPWELFWSHEVRTIEVAMKIEKHIKNMKSRKYILDLSKYAEIIKKLIQKYS